MSKQSVVDRVVVAAAEFGAAADEVDAAVAAALGINRTDLRLLGMLLEHGPLSAGALSSAADLSPAATSTALQRLGNAGHLVRESDPEDRRRLTLSLTKRTASRLRRAYGPIETEGRRGVAMFTTAELSFIERFLKEGIGLQRRHAERIRSRAPLTQSRGASHPGRATGSH